MSLKIVRVKMQDGVVVCARDECSTKYCHNYIPTRCVEIMIPNPNREFKEKGKCNERRN